MTREPHVPPQVLSLPKQLPPCSVAGCARATTKSSGRTWCYQHDPAIPDEQKRAAFRLGGRRGQMTAAEVTTMLQGADIATRDGRQQLRDRFLRLRLAGRVGTGVYRDILAALDGAAKDVERAPGKVYRIP